jgi:hypothetical protein
MKVETSDSQAPHQRKAGALALLDYKSSCEPF